MKNIKDFLSVLAILAAFTFSNAQSTYTLGSTEYIYGAYYSTTGKPKVVRSTANKNAFLKSKGYTSTPYGYEIDHIVPLSEGGSDDPSNMQLLTVNQHKAKTARERTKRAKLNSSSVYRVNTPNYYSTSTVEHTKIKYTRPNYRPDKSSKQTTKSTKYHSSTHSSRAIQTGPRGGRYYINSNGNKTYVKR
ncbi:HNH endonuclease [Bizionia argentinensis JUB59]|uniref:HNH endonuclease n=1 Tax=Bizionia argentinensis JUB59 TaxID=1046627 RepID=G2ED19_9FLAO|nr:HNH endonuclease signature motif containing protein [Bizionia argentinensis]EGV43650.1 HNH endonuclease [Bizionia argentinensis JUB59]